VRPVARPRSLHRQAETFAASFEPALLVPAVWIPLRLGTGGFLLALGWLAAFAPGVRDFFGLEPAVPFALLGASVGLVFLLGSLTWLGRLPPLAFFSGMLVYAALETAMSASFAAFARTPGAYALATLPILRAALNGLAFGSPTGIVPFTTAHGLGVLGAFLLRPEAPQASVLLIEVPAAMAVFLYFALHSARVARARSQIREQRAALEAQLVAERGGRLREANAALRTLRRRNHDARSALAAARLAADRLGALARDDAALAGRSDALARALDVIERTLVDQQPARAGGPPGPGPGLERVDAAAVARRAVQAASRRVPWLRVAVEAQDPGEVLVRGGAAALHQMLDQLVTNAGEGDGARRGGRAQLALTPDPRTGVLAVEITDDGPGFRREILELPVAPFVTTKRRGIGLGLYTVERLARASGGSLSIDNRPGGGAAVTLYLALAESPAEPARPPAADPLALERSAP
jgi:signal transduction histidine kinase